MTGLVVGGAQKRSRASRVAAPFVRGALQMTVQSETTEGIILTDEASGKVKALLDQEGRDDLRLRVAVQPGGCSGLRYQLYFDERELDEDVIGDFSGVEMETNRITHH